MTRAGSFFHHERVAAWHFSRHAGYAISATRFSAVRESPRAIAPNHLTLRSVVVVERQVLEAGMALSAIGIPVAAGFGGSYAPGVSMAVIYRAP